GHLRKEHADLRKGMRTPERGDDRNHWDQPQCEPDRRDAQGAPDCRPRMFGQLIAEKALGGCCRLGAVSLPHHKSGRTRTPTRKTDDPCGDHDEGKGHMAEKDRDKGTAASAIIAPVLRARLPTRCTACSTIARTAAFNPKNSAIPI